LNILLLLAVVLVNLGLCTNSAVAVVRGDIWLAQPPLVVLHWLWLVLVVLLAVQAVILLLVP
jgi:hypothetical protein